MKVDIKYFPASEMSVSDLCFSPQTEMLADVSLELVTIGRFRHSDNCPTGGSQRVDSIDVGGPLVFGGPVMVSLVFQSELFLRIAEVRMQRAIDRRTVHSRMDCRFGKVPRNSPEPEISLHRRVDAFSDQFEGGKQLRSGSEMFRAGDVRGQVFQ